MTKTLFKPAKPLKRGAIVTAEIEPGYLFQSHVIGFAGADVLLDGWRHPVNRGKIR